MKRSRLIFELDDLEKDTSPKLPVVNVPSEKTTLPKVSNVKVPKPTIKPLALPKLKAGELHVYDLGGALIEMTPPYEGRQLYKLLLGKDFPHRGWWKWPESLMKPMPVKANPAVVVDYIKSLNAPGVRTIVMSGRNSNLRPYVLDAIKRTGIPLPKELYLSRKGADQLDWKVSKISRIAHSMNAAVVKIWEDRVDHVAAYRVAFKDLKVIVYPVVKGVPLHGED